MRFDDWNNDELYHHGIKGQKWGIRRYQNEDGSLTPAGRARYGAYEDRSVNISAKKIQKDFNKLNQKYANAAARRASADTVGLSLSAKAIKKGLSPQSAAKGSDALSKKLQKYATERNNADMDMKAIEALQRKILAKAADQGLNVSSKSVRYIGETGRHYVRSILIGPIAGAFISAARGDITEVNSLKIKVKEQKNR